MIFSRGYAEGFFEIAKKSRIIRKTAGLVYLGNILPVFEHFAGVDQALVGNKGVSGNAGDILELAKEMVFTHVHQIGKVLNGDGFADMGVDISRYLIYQRMHDGSFFGEEVFLAGAQNI